MARDNILSMTVVERFDMWFRAAELPTSLEHHRSDADYVALSFTAMVLVGYYAFFHLVEKPHLDRTEPGWDKKPAPLAHDVSQVLPDGRLLMSDGSIRSKP